MCSRRSSGQTRTGRIWPHSRPTPRGGQAKIRLAAPALVRRAAGLDAGLEATGEQGHLPAHLLLGFAQGAGETVERFFHTRARLRDLLRRLAPRLGAEEPPTEAVHRVLQARLRPPHLPAPRLPHAVPLPPRAAPLGRSARGRVAPLVRPLGLVLRGRGLVPVRWGAPRGGPLGVALAGGMGLGVAGLRGWPPLQGAVVGIVRSVASTMVLARLLMDRG